MMVICIPIAAVMALLKLLIWMPLEFSWQMHNKIYVSIISFLFVSNKDKLDMQQAEKDLQKIMEDLKKKQPAEKDPNHGAGA